VNGGTDFLTLALVTPIAQFGGGGGNIFFFFKKVTRTRVEIKSRAEREIDQTA